MWQVDLQPAQLEEFPPVAISETTDHPRLESPRKRIASRRPLRQAQTVRDIR